MNSAAAVPISLIVPTWGDDAAVVQMIERTPLDPARGEWIVSAVRPSAELERLHRAGSLRLVRSEKPSRGAQMNRGAAAASGHLLCFHHADSVLLPAHLDALTEVAGRADVVGGAFHRHFDHRHPGLRRLENLTARMSARMGPLFGDQSIFVRAPVFHSLGGFADIPLMEDVEFSRRLRRSGRVELLRPPMASSARRFERLGRWRSTGLNATLLLLYALGVSPARLHRWYYRHRMGDEKS